MMKPKIGILLLTAEWFTQVGATQGTFGKLPESLTQDAARIEAILSESLDVVNPGVLASITQVHEACDRFKHEAVDAVVITYITWGEDRSILEAIQLLQNFPFLLWAYVPFSTLPDPLSMPEMLRMSGPVGALQASGPLKRLGIRFSTAFGSCDNPSTKRQIVSFAKAAKAVKNLRKVRIGMLPYRCDQMTGTYVDEFRLRHELGPELIYISTYDYLNLCEAIPTEIVNNFVQELKSTHPGSPNLTSRGLERAARASLGVAELTIQKNLDALAIEDVGEELHRMVGLRPCLSVPALFERTVVSMEAEVGGAVAMLILRLLSGLPVMYTEVFTVDETANNLLLGHAGLQDARLAETPADVLLEPDGEYLENEPDSAWMSFRARGGAVTLLSVFCDKERFKLVIAQGEALPGPRCLLGSPHALVRIATPLPEFFHKALTTGMTQHFALVHANLIPELLLLAEILNLDQVTL